MSKLKQFMKWGAIAFVALIVIVALTAPDEVDEAVPASSATTTEAPPLTTFPPTTEAPDITLDNNTLFVLVMSMQDQELLETICPTYILLNRDSREILLANTFTPGQDLTDYPGWTATDMTMAATDWFDQACGAS